MSADEDTELRDLVAQTLETNGILNKIRAELRANVFLALEEQDAMQNKKLENVKLKKFLETSDGQLAMSVIWDFLKYFDLDFTCAVLEPESGNSSGFASRDQVLAKLNLVDTANPIILDLVHQVLKPSISKIPAKVSEIKPIQINDKSEKSTKLKHDWLAKPSANVEDSSAKGNLPNSGLGSLKNIPPLPGVNQQKLVSNQLTTIGAWDDLVDIDKKINELGFELPKETDDLKYDDDFQASSHKSDDDLSITEEIEEDISIGSFAESKGDDSLTTDHTVSKISESGYDYGEIAEVKR